MPLVLANQTKEMAKLSNLDGEVDREKKELQAENTRLMEENNRVMEDNCELRRSLEQKKANLPVEAVAWAREHQVELANELLCSPEATMNIFTTLYKKPEGRKMITAMGSYGFMVGQKQEWAATHHVLLTRDPDFFPEAYDLPPVPEDELAPPFPLS
ncbi:unnamed protein product [Cuscuta campestris]|uniref:Uncharacterized protein n=1 Tax=Cuscuta campestris TaxID=132261 RepID=A0A484MMY0_9ASTE|nr:unnamed protein product [Cuscuta campestris]